MSHSHRFAAMYPAEGEECIAYGRCECGLTKFFLDYYGEIKKGISLDSLKKRVTLLNQLAEAEYAKVAQEHAAIIAVIPKPPRGNWALMRDYYQMNRPWIQKEVRKYGFNNTKRRWNFSSFTLSKILYNKKQTARRMN